MRDESVGVLGALVECEAASGTGERRPSALRDVAPTVMQSADVAAAEDEAEGQRAPSTRRVVVVVVVVVAG